MTASPNPQFEGPASTTRSLTGGFIGPTWPTCTQIGPRADILQRDKFQGTLYIQACICACACA
eukprot:163648-Pleurochrysis_carterae.AAC.4